MYKIDRRGEGVQKSFFRKLPIILISFLLSITNFYGRGSNDSVFEKTMLPNVNALEEKDLNVTYLEDKVRRIQGESIGRLDSLDEVETESDFEILELKAGLLKIF